ncbi:Zn(II)2Cys6 transcription factor [Aspergillus mulundensis]|uniref:Zn(2)-C6 fungal-type domain-containing protein n=1 Tax=Aspergillus mulundensis TaxID=1810919 RepID=A0A3D8Q7V3_9EURO|nr:hypothetical protein DSM5745_11295 [Aspergillus mulundensis]RDW57915.1 hypothetical protein DSM5745_11295 [Aspergillus mulundensis]
MQTPRYSTSRQKACQQCSTAKARCERGPGHGPCTRCMQRGLPCSRAPVQANPIDQHRNDTTDMSLDMAEPPSPFSISEPSLTSPGRVEGPLNTTNTDTSDPRAHSQLMNTPQRHSATASLSSAFPLPAPAPEDTSPRYAGPATAAIPCETDRSNDVLNFSNLALICPINADDIKNRWIQAYIPLPGQAVKKYPTGVSTFIYRTLKSYTSIAVKGRGALLPFIHPKQLSGEAEGLNSSPLTTCLSVLRICANSSPLPGSKDAAAGILQREMRALYSQHTNDNGSGHSLTALATFQSYLLYTMTLFFQLNLHRTANTSLCSAMTNLQDLACTSARHGLLCTAESSAHRTRPRWEEWIVAEATRRTLFVMYLFDSILSAQEGLPTFLGVELRGLPAPAGGLLWRAGCRREWEAQYNLFLVEWGGQGGLRIEELWPEGVGVDERERRKVRIDRWVEGLDEYGTTLYAIMQCTHG